MNAKRSWLIFGIGALIFAGAFVGFVHGAQLTDVDGGKGAVWMGCSVAVMALTVFVSYKVKKLKG